VPGLPVIAPVDHHQQDKEIPLTTIDPFIFFACFDRGLTSESSRAILAYLKTKPELEPDEIPSLSALAVGLVNGSPEKFEPKLSERCLQIDASCSSEAKLLPPESPVST